MTKIRFIGDIHGDFAEYHNLVDEVNHSTVQVGDFGIGFDPNEPVMVLKDKDRFIRGNHDNPGVCAKTPGCIIDGTVEEIESVKIMYVGGAWSIDRAWRTEGVDWWPDEELSLTELYRMVDIYSNTKPDIMVTHDCPRIAAVDLMGHHKAFHETRTQQAFDSMLEIHSPRFWIHGHWHINKMHMPNGRTVFISLGINSFIDIKINSGIIIPKLDSVVGG
jgi:Icc-related predicted phosphoesterase